MIHHALAGNIKAVKRLLDGPSRKKINIDIRKLSEKGAPLLYFMIRAGHVDLVKELRNYGASIYSHMLDEDAVCIHY